MNTQPASSVPPMPASAPPPVAPPPGAVDAAPAPEPKEVLANQEQATDPKENDPGEFARRFADLNKQAQKVRDEQRKIAEIKKSMETDYQDYQRYRQAKESKDAIALLESAGLTYNDATAKVLDNKQLTADEKIALLEKRLDEESKSREAEKKALDEDKAKAAEDAESQAMEENRTWVRSHVEAKGDQYELIQANDAHEMVLEVMEQFWNANQSIPDIDEACSHVESWLEEQIRPFLSLKKFAPKGEGLPAEGKDGKSQPQSFTITNQETAAPAQSRPSGYLSDEESIAQAAKLIRWN